jgi:hypothetical protein
VFLQEHIACSTRKEDEEGKTRMIPRALKLVRGGSNNLTHDYWKSVLKRKRNRFNEYVTSVPAGTLVKAS